MMVIGAIYPKRVLPDVLLRTGSVYPYWEILAILNRGEALLL